MAILLEWPSMISTLKTLEPAEINTINPTSQKDEY